MRPALLARDGSKLLLFINYMQARFTVAQAAASSQDSGEN